MKRSDTFWKPHLQRSSQTQLFRVINHHIPWNADLQEVDCPAFICGFLLKGPEPTFSHSDEKSEATCVWLGSTFSISSPAVCRFRRNLCLHCTTFGFFTFGLSVSALEKAWPSSPVVPSCSGWVPWELVSQTRTKSKPGSRTDDFYSNSK